MVDNFETDTIEPLLGSHGITAYNMLRYKFSLVVMYPWPQMILY